MILEEQSRGTLETVVMSEPTNTNQLPDAGRASQAKERLSRLALLSFILGLLFVTGPPALILGYCGLYAINASEGRLRGRRLAVGGMVLGALWTLIIVCFLVLSLFSRLQQVNARADCANNLRQLGLAIQLYQDNHQKTYPQAVVSNPALPPEQRLSWLAGLLPFLERKALPKPRWQTLVDSLDAKQSWEAPVHQLARSSNVTNFLCRGYPFDEQRSVPGLTDYVGLAGLGDRAASLDSTNPAAGFFGYDRPLTGKRLADQASYILIATETTFANGPWTAGGPPTVRGVNPEAEPLFGRGAPFGGCHPGGLNTLWLDGSVRFQTDRMPAGLFAEMVRINKRGEAQPAGAGAP